MFNFHKPRTYRSAEGCCICRAKSSSSRFTDSRKYEKDTMQCFDLKSPRQGEICNACVLLVKRFKRLPVGSKRNWSHVVDARAGHGGSKIQAKCKNDRTNSRSVGSPAAVATTAAAAAAVSATTLSAANNNANPSSGSSSTTTTTSVNGMSYMPEKFNKILKKSKKVKESSSSSSVSSLTSSASSTMAKQRKSANNGWSQNAASVSLPTTPDSLDSDYEDSRTYQTSMAGSGAAGTVVQFQTQTRASAFRAQAAAEARKRVVKLGSKRRKSLPPKKYRLTEKREEDIQFFDPEEWREQKTCCGILYDCPALGGAVIVDMASYKPCEKHQISLAASVSTQNSKALESSSTDESVKDNPISLIMPSQRNIIQTMPAVVQLQPPGITAYGLSASGQAPTSTHSSSSSSLSSTLTITKTSTPVLKKHHLFFKRQSESFPQGDMVTINSENSTTSNSNISNATTTTTTATTPSSKTESENSNQTPSYTTAKQQQQRHFNEHHAIPPKAHQPPQQMTIGAGANNFSISAAAATLSVSVTSVAASAAAASSLASSAPPMSLASSFSLPPTPSSSSSPYACHNMPQMPKHSLAKVTTISPLLTVAQMAALAAAPSCSKHNSSSSNSNFMHKTKTDTGKIVKHSLEKFNTAVRLKSNEILQDIKPIIKTVDKSYILAKPPTSASLNALNAATAAAAAAALTHSHTTAVNAAYQTLSTYNATNAGQSLTTTTSLSAASPTSSTSSSSSSSTKFSDNSSDSGFDENMLDRKSASPLQEDCEKKLLSRPGVQTMFLASGVQIQGQPQNLMLTGNEVAAKLIQNRRYSTCTRTMTTNHPTTTAVKIAQISTGNIGHHSSSSSSAASVASIMSSAAQAKMRAIYNNSNTIQHENGITTIVPASSLAATTQTAAMQNIAPSTVTITPAPHASIVGGGGGGGGGASVPNHQYSAQNIISRKLTAANIINLQSNNLSNNITNLNSSNLVGGVIGNHHMVNSTSTSSSSTSTTANQKIILLKTPNQTTTAMHHLAQQQQQQQQLQQQQQQQHHHQQQHQSQQTSKYNHQHALTVAAAAGGGNNNNNSTNSGNNSVMMSGR